MPPTAHIPTAAELRTRKPGQSVKEHHDAVETARNQHWDQLQILNRRSERRDLTKSEHRSFVAHRDQVEDLAELLEEIGDSPEARKVDYSQVIMATGLPPWDTDARAGQILGAEQRVADWVAGRGLVREEHRELSLGLMLRGWLTSRWDGAEREQRALLEGTQAGGGVLVPTPLSASIIDRARNVSRCFQAGARVVPMDSQTLKVPRLTGSSAPAWRVENAAIAEGDLTLDSISFTARSLAFIVKASRELIEDGRDVENTVRNDLAAQVALELDRVMLRGSGTAPEPRGVRNQSGITVTAFGGANGAAPTNWDHYLDAIQVLRAANYEPTAVISAPRSEATLMKLKDSTGAYLPPPAGLPTRLTTNQVPTNLTTGTSTDTTEVYLGDWSNLWLGLRTELTFTLAERYADVGQVALLTWVRADVQLAHPEAFSVTTGVRP